MKENWIDVEDYLPEESGRISEKPFGAYFYGVLLAIRFVGSNRTCTYKGLRFRRLKTGTEVDNLVDENQTPFNKWVWKIDHLAPDVYEVVAWTWLPKPNDPRWIRDKMPEELGYTKNILGMEMTTVLALARSNAAPNAELVIEMRNRIFCPKPYGEGRWQWSLEEFSKVVAWMPQPKYER